MIQLDSKLLQAAGSYELLVQQLMVGFVQGLHRSPFKGSSQEFANYRPYQYGDPVKLVDWRLWARTDNYFVREYEQETNMRVHLFLDTSKSMDYGEDGENKFLYSRILCSVLALLIARQKDSPGLALIDGSPIGYANWLPPSNRKDSMDYLLNTLENVKAEGRQDQIGDITGFLQETSRRSLAIILTDGYQPNEQLKGFLENLRVKDTEVIFFHVLHEDEIDPQFEGDFLMEDSETGKEIPVDGVVMRDLYRAKFDQFVSDLEALCHANEVDYHRISTQQPLDEALQTYLSKRGVK